MLDKDEWINALVDKLRDAFGERLLFVGLQGSYRRSEATEKSDIDAMVILDRLELEDLKVYRAVVGAMPEHEKACGFISGKGEMQGWPRYEIFQLKQETEERYGSLRGLLPTVTVKDIEESVKIATANLYHALCHTFIYDDDAAKTDMVLAAYKSIFFILQILHYLRTGDYICTKDELRHVLPDSERELLGRAISLKETGSVPNPDQEFDTLITWSGNILKTADLPLCASLTGR